MKSEISEINVIEAAEFYITDIASRGMAPLTVRGRASWVRRFAESATRSYRTDRDSKRAVCKTGDMHPRYVTKFFEEGNPRTGKKFSPGNYNNGLTALRGFLTWLENSRYMPKESAGWLLGERKLLHEERQPKYYIPAADFPRVLDVAGEWHIADRAVMAMALYTLGRQGELSGLQLRHVNLDERTIMMRRPKRQRWTEVGITRELMGELVTWLEWYAQQMECVSARAMMEDHPDWYLLPRRHYCPFQGEDGKYLKTGPGRYYLAPTVRSTHLERVVKRVLDALGVDGRHTAHVTQLGEGIHTVRRSGARALYDQLSEVLGNDKAIFMVSVMLDHEDIKITLLYIGRDIERERLNDWLRENSMYGEDPNPAGATVTTLPARAVLRALDAPEGASAGDDRGAVAQSV